MIKTATPDEIQRAYQNFEEGFDINIPEASQANVARLQEMLGTLSPEEQYLYDTITHLPFTLRHGTSFGDPLREQTMLLSVQERARTDGMTRNSNTNAMSNRDDNIFFVLGINNHRVPLFLGNETEIVTAPFNEDIQKNSGIFVAPHLDEFMGNNTLGSMIFGDTTRTINHVWELNPDTLEETKEKTYTYKRKNGEIITRKYGFGDEIFAGEDIIPGLALKFIQELRDIGGKYQQNLLDHTHDNDLIGHAYNAHFQSWVYPEAQVPVRFDLAREGVEWSRSEMHPKAEELHTAAKNGDIETVDRLLDEGVPIDTPFNRSSSALLEAILACQSDMALHLLDRGADTTTFNPNLFGKVFTLPLALSRCDDRVANSILDKAIIADPHFPEAKHTISEGLPDALETAIKMGKIGIAHRILNEFDTDIEYRKSALVASSIASGNNDWAEFFAEKGADVNTPSSGFLDIPCPPLLQLAAKPPEKRLPSDTDLVNRLVAMGAEIDAVYRRRASPGRASLIGRNPGNNLRTALFIAAENGNLPIVKKLLEHGATIDRPNFLGETPLHAAKRGNHDDVANYLQKMGAKSIAPQEEKFKNIGRTNYTVAGIITGTNEHGERCVLVGRKRDTEKLLGDYCFPGGGVDNDPDPLTAVLREIYEETRINLRKILPPEKLEAALVHHYEKVEYNDNPYMAEQLKRTLRDHQTYLFDIGDALASLKPKAGSDFNEVRIVSLDHDMAVAPLESITKRYTVDGVPILGSNGMMVEWLNNGEDIRSPEAKQKIDQALQMEYEGNQQLIDAFAQGDMQKANEFLQYGISINATGTFAAPTAPAVLAIEKYKHEDKVLTATPLVVAAYLGDLDMLDFVLSKQPYLETQNLSFTDSALEAAILSASPDKQEVVERLLNAGVHPDALMEADQKCSEANPLIKAIQLKEYGIVEMLLERGATANYQHDTQDGRCETAIVEAIKTGDEKLTKLVLSFHPNLNYSWVEPFNDQTQYESALEHAKEGGNTQITGMVAAEALVQDIAVKIDVGFEDINVSVHPDDHGKPSVHISVSSQEKAKALSEIVNGTVRKEPDSGRFYVQLGSVRVRSLFEDKNYGQNIYDAIAIAEKDRVIAPFRNTGRAENVRSDIPGRDGQAGLGC